QSIEGRATNYVARGIDNEDVQNRRVTLYAGIRLFDIKIATGISHNQTKGAGVLPTFDIFQI
ncbi:hypothetical protein, partial [Pseudomonas viridiflava]|uniref:hypothetical protein n=1 Tax=Pseudomonas viridiflava TaxID=33069 RepID=UPI0019D0B349